jgi:hypothetical protein
VVSFVRHRPGMGWLFKAKHLAFGEKPLFDNSVIIDFMAFGA